MDRIARVETAERETSLTVSRALSILRLFSRQRPEIGITELSRELGLSKSIVHRLLRTLEQHQFVERNPETRRYRVGYGAFRLGNLFIDSRVPAHEALPVMRRLVTDTGHSSQLGVLSGDIMVIVAAVEAPGPIKFIVPVGDYRLGHTSAMGKAGLAALSDDEVSEILKRCDMVPQTPYSITDADELIAQLRDARRCGYTINWEENHIGVGSVAAPVPSPRPGQVMAVSLGFPTQLVNRSDLPRLGKAVRMAAEEIGQRLYGAPVPIGLVAVK